MKAKYFIITVDTEGDNLWAYNKGDVIQTKNLLFVNRFQELCEKYHFPPVYLTNYEAITDMTFVEYIKNKVLNNLCEVGIHVHAWNTPPYYHLNDKLGGNPFLIEYPLDVRDEKFASVYNLIKSNIGKAPVSHRAGRWAMDEAYFKLLKKYNIKVDCSLTPYVDWSKTAGATLYGPSYKRESRLPSRIQEVFEVPMSIRRSHIQHTGTIKHKVHVILCGKNVWLRPASSSLYEMVSLVNNIDNEENVDYLEFMLHSSELMPGGSIYFQDKESIDQLYNTIEGLFSYVQKLGYTGITLENYEAVSNH